MLAAIDSSHDQGLRVQVPAVKLAAIGKLKEPLTDLYGRAVHFVKEEQDRLLASRHKPIWSVPGGSLAARDAGLGGIGETQEIALSHLRRAALDYRKLASGCDHVDDLRLALTVPASNEHGKTGIEDERGDVQEGGKIDSHDVLRGGSGSSALSYVVHYR
jgi:hypothetical protein